MEVYLKCFFDSFNLSERDLLYAKFKRKEVIDYFNGVIECCSKGQECSLQRSAGEAVLGIIRYHEHMKNLNGTVCRMGKFHNILYIAVKLCYDWKLKDTGIVSALLEQIYLCENTFERICVGAVFGTTACQCMAGWKSDFLDQRENLRAMVYFLGDFPAIVFFIDHANDAGMEFSYEDEEAPIRFVDVPLETCGKSSVLKLAVQLGCPDPLHVLLRYGAALDSPYNDINGSDIMRYILKSLMEHKQAYPYNIITCLQLILRALPRIVLGSHTRAEILEIYPDLVEDGLIPPSRCGLEPPELKHLCRCVIRKRLWENFMLPSGIQSFDIPRTLKRYLDIMLD